MATIRKRNLKSGGFVYDLDFTYRGKRYIISTKTSDRKVAGEILANIEIKIARGTFNMEDYEKKEVAIGDFQVEYLKYASSRKETSTVSLETVYLKQFILFVGEGRTLRSIDAALVDQWNVELLSRASAATFGIVLRTLRSIMNTAKRWGYLDANPFEKVQKVRVPERRLFLTDEEVVRLYQVIDQEIESPAVRRDNILLFRRTFRLYVEFLLNTGLRRDEAIRIRPEHIDWARNVVYVEHTKTKQTRTVPLNKRARAVLRSLDETVLFSKLNKHDVTNKFAYYLKKAGLEGFKLHSLRHTFSCRLLAHGADLYTISRILGHTDIKTTMIYAKTNVELLRGAVSKLDLIPPESGGAVDPPLLGGKTSSSTES